MVRIEKLFPESDFLSFIARIKTLLNDHNIDTSSWQLDHICYRVETIEKYNDTIAKLQDKGKLLSSSIIQGRPISTFKINDLFRFQNKEVNVIEIPSPKDNRKYNVGFEHVEFVIDGKLKNLVKSYPKVNFDQRNINKTINPEVRLSSKDKKTSIKFHCQSLEEVILKEKIDGQ